MKIVLVFEFEEDACNSFKHQVSEKEASSPTGCQLIK